MTLHINDFDDSDIEEMSVDQVPISKGMVVATCVYGCEKPGHLDEWFSLPAGKMISIPAGETLIFSVEKGWKKADFFDEGSITGPVVFSRDKASSATEAFKCHHRSDISPTDFLIFLSLTVVMAYRCIFMTSQPDILYYISIGVTLLFGLISLSLGTKLFRIKRSLRKGDDDCLKMLRKIQPDNFEV